MEEESFGYLEEEILEIIRRFERMHDNNENYFFDVAEFETIIDYYLDLNDVKYAYDAAKLAIRQHPEAPSIKLRKAKVLIDKGRPLEAIKVINLLEKLEPGNFEVFVMKGAALGMIGDMNGIKKYFDIALSMDDADEISILMSITSILNNLNHYSLLPEYLERLVVLEPDYITHLYDLAYAYEKTGRYEEGIKYYLKFLNEEPFSDNAWYNLGLLYSKTASHSKALEAYEYAIAINPENIFAVFNMANILCEEGEYARALEAYLQYLDFEKDSSEAMAYAADCYNKLGNPDEAMKMYSDAIEIDPDYDLPWYGMGVIMIDKHPDESVKCFKKAVSLKEDNPDYWYYLSEAYYNNNSLKDSFRSLIKVVTLNPYYDSAWLRMGKLIITRRYYDHATQLLEKGIKVLGDVHGIRYILASAYLYSGNKTTFLRHFERALDDSPDRYRFFRSLFPEQMMDEHTKTLIKENTKR